MDLPSGTIIGGMKKLLPLLKPVHDKLIERNREQEHWHGDETRWLVFAKKEGKTGHRWMLWLLRSKEAAVYLLDPTRAHEVPEKALGPNARGILSVDRYSAYKAMKQVIEKLEALEIFPVNAKKESARIIQPSQDLTERVIRRAEELRRAWAGPEPAPGRARESSQAAGRAGV